MIYLAYIVNNIVITVCSGKEIYPDIKWNSTIGFVIPSSVVVGSFAVYCILTYISKLKSNHLINKRYTECNGVYESLLMNLQID